eukprot:m.90726 g.90726  ORF g.90726 m.90726 type:complete len:262 (-) comp8475_c0_seq4:1045-1830(-)
MSIGASELARRAIFSFGEMLAVLGDTHVAGAAAMRLPHAVGAAIPLVVEAGSAPWFHAAIVPAGAALSADTDDLPNYLWTYESHVAGRSELPDLAMPAMALEVDQYAHVPAPLRPEPGSAVTGPTEPIIEPIPLTVLGPLNERAYDSPPGFVGDLMGAVRDARVRTYGIRGRDGDFICGAIGLHVGDDMAVHYVATEPSQQRRGLATHIVHAIVCAARGAGCHTVTLQASKDGCPVYTRMGFASVGTMRVFAKASAPPLQH